MTAVKTFLKKTPVYTLYKWLKPKPDYDPYDYDYKRGEIIRYAQQIDARVLIETGTCEGGTVHELRDKFDRIVSVELDPILWQKAKSRFAGLEHVEILQGNSADHLEGILQSLTQPAVFWLDAHYSGTYTNHRGEVIQTAHGNTATPLEREVATILKSAFARHVILIDDARELGRGDYPSARTLRSLCRVASPRYTFEIVKDIARLLPAG